MSAHNPRTWWDGRPAKRWLVDQWLTEEGRKIRYTVFLNGFAFTWITSSGT